MKRAREEPTIPDRFLCPLTKRIMRDPVKAIDGVTYEREAIEKHVTNSNESPVVPNALLSPIFVEITSLKAEDASQLLL